MRRQRVEISLLRRWPEVREEFLCAWINFDRASGKEEISLAVSEKKNSDTREGVRREGWSPHPLSCFFPRWFPFEDRSGFSWSSGTTCPAKLPPHLYTRTIACTCVTRVLTFAIFPFFHSANLGSGISWKRRGSFEMIFTALYGACK